jgi:hypothetical protein
MAARMQHVQMRLWPSLHMIASVLAGVDEGLRVKGVFRFRV